MAAVLDRVVPSRRREKDRLRHLGDSHDSRFGDVTISAPHQGGWSHPGTITKLKNEWDLDGGQSPVDNTRSPVDDQDKEYDQIIIVDDTQSDQGTTYQESLTDKSSINFTSPLPSWPTKRSHSRNGSVVSENVRTITPAQSLPGAFYKPIRDTYMQEYARMSPDGSQVGPWSRVHDANSHEPDPVHRTTPTNWSHSPSTSPPPLTNSTSDVATPASIEFTRSNAGSPSVSILSPVSEDFAKDDPRHNAIAAVGMTPLPSKTPQPPYSQSPPPSDSEDFPWAALPPVPLHQLSSDEDRPRPRSRARSASRRADSGFFPRSRSVDFPETGRSTPPTRNFQFYNGRWIPSADAQFTGGGQFFGPSWDPNIRSRSPATSRPGTAEGFRANATSQTSHSNIYTFDGATTVNIFNGENLMTPAEYEKFYNERMRSRSVITDRTRTPSVVADRARTPSVGPQADRGQDRDTTPVPRGRLRSRSGSRTRVDAREESEANNDRCRSASRGQDLLSLRKYMTFDDLPPEDIPLPASRPGSRPASRPASRATSQVRDRAPSRIGRRDLSRGRDAFVPVSYFSMEDIDPHNIPLPPSQPGSRAASRARDRAPSRAGNRESSRPRASSRNPQSRLADANGYYDGSDGDVNTSSGEDQPPFPPLPPSRPQSRRPSVSIATTTMSSNGGIGTGRPPGGAIGTSDRSGFVGANGTLARQNFKAEVAREAEFLLRTMRGEGGRSEEDSEYSSVRDSLTESTVSGGTSRSGGDKSTSDAAGGERRKNQLVPDDESLWG